MFDFPVHNVQIIHESVTNIQASDESFYQLSEIDLSFSDALAGTCSGESSSGPIERIKTQKKLV